MARDRLDNQLISVLSVYPTLTRHQLAARLHRTYETVQRVLSRLAEQRKVRPGFVVTADGLEGLVNYWVMIQTRSDRSSTDLAKDSETDYQSQLCARISAHLSGPRWRDQLVFRRIDILFGADWDIILLISAKSAQAVQSLVTGYLRSAACPEIVGTRTAWSTQAFVLPLAGPDLPTTPTTPATPDRGNIARSAAADSPPPATGPQRSSRRRAPHRDRGSSR